MKKGFFDIYFAIVRHPYTRFVSAFKIQRDRFKKIAPETRLEDFVGQVYKNGVDSMPLGWMDNHFMPMTKFFPPSARVRIFKFEQGLKPFHQWFEMKLLPKPSGISVPHVNKEIVRSGTKSDDELNDDSKGMIFKMYKRDFEDFKYSPTL